MISEQLLSLVKVNSPRVAREIMVAYMRERGFTSSAALVLQQTGCNSQFLVDGIDWLPSSYKPLYEDGSAGASDPVMQHCKRSGIPIVWNQQTYVSQQQGHRWERMDSSGLTSGIACSFHLSGGRHVVIGSEFDTCLPKASEEINRLAADLQLFGAYFAEATALFPELESTRYAIGRKSPDSTQFNLSERELSILGWSAIGKTAWEIGQLLSISEHTVNKHLTSICRKLDRKNKQAAATRAISLGLIQP